MVMKIHQYLCGRKFLLVKDHKPLSTLLGLRSGIPTLAAATLQRWDFLLAAYQYDIEYHSTTKHVNTDCLSHLLIYSNKANEELHGVRLINQVCKVTQTDPTTQ